MLRNAAIAALLLAQPVAAKTPCEIAAAYQDEMLLGQSERRKARVELSGAVADTATKETHDDMAHLLSLVVKMASDDLKAYSRYAPLRDALREACN